MLSEALQFLRDVGVFPAIQAAVIVTIAVYMFRRFTGRD